MNGTVSVLISNVEICSLVDECLHYVVVEARNTQMKRTPEYAATHVNISSVTDKCLCCQVVLLPDGQTEWSALIFVEGISVDLVHQKPIDYTGISIGSCLVQNCSLSIVSKIFVKSLAREVL